MRKKIAVYASGWNDEILHRVMDGFRQRSQSDDVDLFIFLSYSSMGAREDENEGEQKIFHLPVMTDFDGLILFSNSLNTNEIAIELAKQASESGVPAVSLGKELFRLPCIKMDDSTGMRELVTHLIQEHTVKRVAFIAGPADHADSMLRLQVTKDVLSEHGLSLREEDIYYGNWSYMTILNHIKTIVSDPLGLPDVIVCANDFTALSAISELKNCNLSVPDDILVTGFDHINKSQIFYPSITSVDQDLEKVGALCFDVLLGDLSHSKEPVTLTVTSHLAVCESCGCTSARSYESKRNEFCQKYFSESLRKALFQQNMRSIAEHIEVATDFAVLQSNLRGYYTRNQVFEGDNFYIVLHPKFFENILEDYKNVLASGKFENLSVLIARQDGELKNIHSVNRHQLVPGYDKITLSHTYYFLSMHSLSYSIGYIIFVDNPLVVSDNLIEEYARNFRLALHDTRTNMRLDALNQNLLALYNKDAMTGLYNRFGYENLAVPLFNSCTAQGQPVMVCFVDINSMKKINDVYGHLQGDIAIICVAKAIKKVERENWISIRYGGDEFLLIASCSGPEDAENIKQQILTAFHDITTKQPLPYEPTISCGYVVSNPNDTKTIPEYIKEADELMYEIKRNVHAGECD